MMFDTLKEWAEAGEGWRCSEMASALRELQHAASLYRQESTAELWNRAHLEAQAKNSVARAKAHYLAATAGWSPDKTNEGAVPTVRVDLVRDTLKEWMVTQESHGEAVRKLTELYHMLGALEAGE